MDAFVLHTLFKRLLHRTPLKHLNSRHWLMLFALLPACLGLLGFWRGGWTLALIAFFLSQSVLLFALSASLHHHPRRDSLSLAELWRHPVAYHPPESHLSRRR